MHYDFDKVINRRNTGAIKWDVPETDLPMWVADMDFETAPAIKDALKERVEHGIFGYTTVPEAWYEAYQNWWERRHNFRPARESMLFCNGVIPAIDTAIRDLTEPGDQILILTPTYNHFFISIKDNSRVPVECHLTYDNGSYTLNKEDFAAKAADPKTKILLLSNPQNPTGTIWDAETLNWIGEICKANNVLVIADEIHCDLTRRNVVHTPMLKLAAEIAPDYCDRIVSCVAPSKTFNLAGLAFSNIIIPGAEFQKKWFDLVDGQLSLGHGCNPLSLAGAIAAYNEGDEWLDQLKEYLDGNIEYIGQFVREHMPKAKTAVCQGTYLLWVDMNGYCSDIQKLEHAMQQIGRVALDEGYIFGDEGNGYERINVAMPRALVEDCMMRMKKAADWLEEQND